MRVVHISQTPVAGACHLWSQAFREAGYTSCSIARKNYGDGRLFHSDYNWPPKAPAITQIQLADVIFCHQGQAYKYAWYPKGKPTVGIYHSQPDHVYRKLEADGWPWAVMGQYQPRLYPGCRIVPNLLPLQSPHFQPRTKAPGIRIAYSPSNTTSTGWDDKGYEKTVAVLKRVVGQDGIGCEADIITHVCHEECLARKAVAHIVIDECATGSYHRSSLEGLALGYVVVNGCDDRCIGNIGTMTGGCGHPFILSSLDALEDCLADLIEDGRYKLAAAGMSNRRWAECAWNPAELINRNIKPLIDEAMAQCEPAC